MARNALAAILSASPPEHDDITPQALLEALCVAAAAGDAEAAAFLPAFAAWAHSIN